MNDVKHIDIPVRIGLRGDIEITVLDAATRTVKHHHKQKNIIQNVFMDMFRDVAAGWNPLYWGSTVQLCGGSPECHIGTGTNAADGSGALAVPVQTEVAKVAIKSGSQVKSSFGANPVFNSQLFEFPTGTYIGTITEVGLSATINQTPTGTRLRRSVARQLLTPTITLGAGDILQVRWKVTANFGTQIFDTTIVDGQRGGGNVDCRLTINNDQMMTHCLRTATETIGIAGVRNPYYHLMVRNAFVILGDDNAASNLTTDTYLTIKGNSLYAGQFTSALSTFTSGGTLPQRFIQMRTGFADTIASGTEIGEMVVATTTDGNTTVSRGGLFRITFTPKLDKAALHRLWITIKIIYERD